MPPSSETRTILFISLDGMTDPLGQSQVLPYLAGLAEKGHRISLISCEKATRFAQGKANIESYCQEHHIGWHPQPYLERPRGIATFLQVRRMYREAVRLHEENHFDATHCRSYIPALVGLKLKRKKGVSFIFDMRGFWADERVEGGLWDVKKPWYKAAYQYMKRREQQFLQEADHIVSLTFAGKRIMEEMGLGEIGPVSVIPCSVDLELFRGENREARDEMGGGKGLTIDEPGLPRAQSRGITHEEGKRRQLGIEKEALVFVYLGSVGSWYMLEEMLLYFLAVRKQRPDAHFLFISQSPAESILQKATEIGLPKDALSIRSAARKEIPALLSAADVGLFFIKPCFSKQASSPTKLGEMLAMGLPVIANTGVGDLDDFFDENRVGVLIDPLSEGAFDEVLPQLDRVLSVEPNLPRKVAEEAFALSDAIAHYHSIYVLSGRER